MFYVTCLWCSFKFGKKGLLMFLSKLVLNSLLFYWRWVFCLMIQLLYPETQKGQRCQLANFNKHEKSWWLKEIKWIGLYKYNPHSSNPIIASAPAARFKVSPKFWLLIKCILEFCEEKLFRQWKISVLNSCLNIVKMTFKSRLPIMVFLCYFLFQNDFYISMI